MLAVPYQDRKPAVDYCPIVNVIVCKQWSTMSQIRLPRLPRAVEAPAEDLPVPRGSHPVRKLQGEPLPGALPPVQGAPGEELQQEQGPRGDGKVLLSCHVMPPLTHHSARSIACPSVMYLPQVTTDLSPILEIIKLRASVCAYTEPAKSESRSPFISFWKFVSKSDLQQCLLCTTCGNLKVLKLLQ